MIAVLHYIALLGSIMSVSLLLPVLHGLAGGEFVEVLKLTIYALLGSFVFISILMSVRGRAHDLSRTSSLYFVVCVWLLFPALFAIPVADIFALSYGEALFETISAFTTTAAEGVLGAENLSNSALWLRMQIQWLGGFTTLVTFALFLGSMGIGGLPLRYTGVADKTSEGVSSINRFMREILQIYGGLSVLAFVLFLLSGLTPLQSLTLASTAISTGGYMPKGIGAVDELGSVSMIIFALILIIGGTSIFWIKAILSFDKVRLQKHRESYVVIGLIFVLTLVFFSTLSRVSGVNGNVMMTLSESLFNAASLVTTSGLESRPGVFSLLSPLLLVFVLFFGAGCYSTAGGVKLYRLGAMVFHTSKELSLLIYPSGVGRARYGSERYNVNVLKAIWMLFCTALAVVFLGSFALSLSGLSFEPALAASMASFSNAGPFYTNLGIGLPVNEWPAYFDMNLTQKLILSTLMLIGRLEVLAFFAMFLLLPSILRGSRF